MGEPPAGGRRGRRVSVDGIELAVVVSLALVAAGLTYWRLYYGVDFTDESFYVAVPYRYVRGADAFVSEHAVAQGFVGLLLYPFVRAYYGLAGTGGIVLFVRHLHFLFTAAVAAAAAASLRPMLPLRTGALVGLAAVAFVPFEIHSLSYNTMGGGFLTAGCLLGFLSLREPERRGVRAAAGLCLGLTAFSYPPLGVAAAVAFGAQLALARGPDRRAALVYQASAAALPLVAMAAVVLAAGLGRFRADVRERSSGEHVGANGLWQVVHHELDTLRHPVLLAVAVAVLALAWRFRREAAVLPLFVLPLLALPAGPVSYLSSISFAACFAWLAVPLLPIVRRRTGAAQLAAAVWLPGMIGSFVVGLSSSDGAQAAGVGALPAMLVSSVFLVWALEESLPLGLRRAGIVPAVTALVALLVFEAFPTYRDSPVSKLDARIRSGAFAGLYTTSEKRDLIVNLGRDLAGVDASCRIVFLDFPAGYLLTDAAPSTTSAWKELHPQLLALYERDGYPDVVVAAASQRGDANDPLLAALRMRDFRHVAARDAYDVYRHPGPGCGSGPTAARAP